MDGAGSLHKPRARKHHVQMIRVPQDSCLNFRHVFQKYMSGNQQDNAGFCATCVRTKFPSVACAAMCYFVGYVHGICAGHVSGRREVEHVRAPRPLHGSCQCTSYCHSLHFMLCVLVRSVKMIPGYACS